MFYLFLSLIGSAAVPQCCDFLILIGFTAFAATIKGKVLHFYFPLLDLCRRKFFHCLSGLWFMRAFFCFVFFLTQFFFFGLPSSSYSFFTTPTSPLMDVETLFLRKPSELKTSWRDPFTLARERRSKGDAIHFLLIADIMMTSVCRGRSLWTLSSFQGFHFFVFFFFFIYSYETGASNFRASSPTGSSHQSRFWHVTVHSRRLCL